MAEKTAKKTSVKKRVLTEDHRKKKLLADKNRRVKKKAARTADDLKPPLQLEFDAEGFPEKLPKELCELRDSFLGAKRASVNAANVKHDREAALIEGMKKLGIDRIRLDGESKFFELSKKDSLQIKTIKKDSQERSRKDSDDLGNVEHARN